MTTNKKTGRPYKLSIDDHRDMIRRYQSGQRVRDFPDRYKIGLMTVYQYLKLDPEKRLDV
jgi:hypothetical protein